MLIGNQENKTHSNTFEKENQIQFSIIIKKKTENKCMLNKI